MSLPPTRFDFTAPVPRVEHLGVVHIVAIGGAGMSAVARLLLELGGRVSGSDSADSPSLRALEALGATVHVGHDAAHLEGVDTVVVSSAIRESNPELAAARARGLRVLHRAQALTSLMGTTAVRVAVAGANGKTTTTAMLAEALAADGLDPSYAVGADLVRGGGNARLGAGGMFVVEADESDGSFVSYRPQVAVVTSVQPDHLDFYGTFDGVREGYRAFVETIDRVGPGLLVACVDDGGARELAGFAAQLGVRVVGYGQADDADVRIESIEPDGLTSRASLWHNGVRHALVVPAPGAHTVFNAAGAFAAAVEGMGASPAGVLAGLADFGGTRRRFELKGEAGGIRVVDDYAHNPAKVAAAVATARGVVGEDGRLLVVFQPHLFSRTRDFAEEFGAALAPADVVIVMDVYGAREDPLPGVTGALVADAVTAASAESAVGAHAGQVLFVGERADVVPAVMHLARRGDLVLTVGAGDVTELGPVLLARLSAGRAGLR
ncbi:MAG: UDP-N-acetylmuramate--L-alanine ligase [Candidatus Phosphoribacter sp.]